MSFRANLASLKYGLIRKVTQALGGWLTIDTLLFQSNFFLVADIMDYPVRGISRKYITAMRYHRKNMQQEIKPDDASLTESNSAPYHIHELHTITPVSKYLALGLFILLPFLGAWIGYQYGFLDMRKQENTLSHQPINSADNQSANRITSNVTNVAFTVPKGWERVTNLDTLELPPGVSNLWFALKDKGTECIIAGGNFERDLESTHRQISFADRVFNETDQFDGNWYIPTSTNPPSQDSIDVTEVRKYLTNEVRVSGSFDFGTFLLWNSIFNAVPDDCNTALNSLLKSTKSSYEMISLSERTNGTLWIKHMYDNVHDDPSAVVTAKMYLLLTNAAGETFKVMDLPDSFEGVYSYWYQNKLYGIVNERTSVSVEEEQYDSGIYVIDPFAGTQKFVEGTQKKSSYIGSVYAHGGVIYYARFDEKSTSCLDSHGECKGDVYKTNTAGGEQTLIAANISAKHILGYSETEKALYLSNGYADAGCGSAEYSRVVNNVKEILGNYSGCSGDADAGTLAFEAAIKAMDEKFPNVVRSQIQIGKGTVTLQNIQDTIEESRYDVYVFTE